MPKSIKTAANTEKEKGKISRKVCEIVPGTSLGILMVISFSTQNLYKLTVKNAATKEASSPFVPIYSVENPPSIGETLNNRKLTTEASITEVVLITLFFGKRRFIESAKQRAVVAETSNPTTPIE